MHIQNFLTFLPFFNDPGADRSEATRTDDRRLAVSDAIGESAASRQNHRSDAARGTALMGRRLSLSSTLPQELLERIAGFLPIKELKEEEIHLRLVDKTLCRAANAVVKLKVNHADELVAALEAYRAANAVVKLKVNHADGLVAAPQANKEGEITKITLGNADYLDSGAATFTDEHLALLEDLPFESVDVSYCRITDKGLAKLRRRLKAVNLSWCTRITDKGLANLPPGLQVVNLSGCTRITDAGVIHIPRGAKKVDLSGCLQITDAGVADIPRGATEVNLSLCFQLTDAGVAHIPDSATWVNLSGCEGITRAAIDALRARLAPVSVIIIDDVSSTDDKAISPRQDGLITFDAWSAE